MRKIKAKYTDNKLDGRYEVYEDDKLIERGKYQEGKKVMLWVRYYKNGIIKSAKYYKDGKLDGFYYLYNSRGEIRAKRNYLDGKRRNKI